MFRRGFATSAPPVLVLVLVLLLLVSLASAGPAPQKIQGGKLLPITGGTFKMGTDGKIPFFKLNRFGKQARRGFMLRLNQNHW